MKHTRFFLLVICISCLLPGFAQAARQVPGTLPDVRPLQPLPSEAQVNIEKNIQNVPDEQKDNPSPPSLDEQSPEDIKALSGNSATTARRKWLLVVSVIAAAVVMVFAIWHRRE